MNSAVKTPGQKPVEVTALPDYRLHTVMENGQTLNLDLTPLISSRKAFWRLKNFRYFKQVSIDPLGGLCWPEGEDISPTKMLAYAVNTPSEVKAA
jgi:hypothetical protein